MNVIRPPRSAPTKQSSRAQQLPTQNAEETEEPARRDEDLAPELPVVLQHWDNPILNPAEESIEEQDDYEQDEPKIHTTELPDPVPTTSDTANNAEAAQTYHDQSASTQAVPRFASSPVRTTAPERNKVQASPLRFSAAAAAGSGGSFTQDSDDALLTRLRDARERMDQLAQNLSLTSSASPLRSNGTAAAGTTHGLSAVSQLPAGALSAHASPNRGSHLPTTASMPTAYGHQNGYSSQSPNRYTTFTGSQLQSADRYSLHHTLHTQQIRSTSSQWNGVGQQRTHSTAYSSADQPQHVDIYSEVRSA